VQRPVREQGESSGYSRAQAARLAEAEQAVEAQAAAVEEAAMQAREQAVQREEAAVIKSYAFALPRPKTSEKPPPEPAVDVGKLEAELQAVLAGQGQAAPVHRTNRASLGPVRTDVARSSGWRPGSGGQPRSPASPSGAYSSAPPGGAAPLPPPPGPPPGPAPPGPTTG
jgi:hypothetical protein